jgi:biotin--protein ligase
VRVKWPNDIYGETDEGLRKVGGILVNSSYAGQDFTLVVGTSLHPVALALS